MTTRRPERSPRKNLPAGIGILGRWRLRTLIAVAFLALWAPVLIAFATAQYIDLRWQLELSAASQLRAAAISGVQRLWPDAPQRVTAGPRRLVVPSAWTTQARELAQEVGSHSILARVALANGRELASFGGPPGDPPPLDPEQVAKVAADDPHGLTYFTRTASEGWQAVLLPLLDAHAHKVGVLAVYVGWHLSANVLATLARNVLLLGLLLFALVVPLSARLARVLTSPLERLTEAASRLAEGDLNARTELGDGRNEIFMVARQFDYMAERVQQTLSAQQRFIEDASHELRTPLTILAGTVDILPIAPSEEIRQRSIESIVQEVAKMRRLIDDLLLLSRAERTPQTVREPVDVSAMLDDLREYGTLIAGGRTLDVRCEDAPMVHGDREQLERALRNLLDNAVRYTPMDGRIVIRAQKTERGVRFEVMDNGIGISADDLPHVFDRFYRADVSRARRSGGSGLGLAIVRSIVTMHEGTCGLESRLGEGTRVWIELGVGIQGPVHDP